MEGTNDTVTVLTVLTLWYAPAFGAAALLSRAGIDPLPWVLAAWLGGLLAAAAALGYLATTRRQRPAPAPVPVRTGPRRRADGAVRSPLAGELS